MFLKNFNPVKTQSITYYTFQKSIYFLFLSVLFLFVGVVNALFDLVFFCAADEHVVNHVLYHFRRTNEYNPVFGLEVGHPCKLIDKRLDQPVEFMRRITY